MSLVEINWHPTDRQLRQFGWIGLVALPAIGWLWGAGATTIIALAAMGGLLAAAGQFFPAGLKPLFLALTVLATPIGMVVGELAMLMIYFLVFVPFGVVFKLLKRDALQRNFDRNLATYWQPKKAPSDVASYYRQS